MFVDCDAGYVNLAHVAKIRQSWHKNDHGVSIVRSVFLTAAGDVLGEKDGTEHDDFGLMASPVVANTVDVIAHVFYCGREDEERPGDDDIWTATYPVLAWRIPPSGSPLPILPEEMTSGGRLMLGLADGRILEPDSIEFANISRARANVLLRAQLDWDMHNPRPAPSCDPCGPAG